MRQYLVDSNQAVEAVLRGLAATSPVVIQRVGSHSAIVYSGNRNRRVRLLIGGGSGHEPLFLGAVGPGMADGAVAGQIFAAPNPESILATIEALEGETSVILLYGNYSGDVLNFGFAAEEAQQKGMQVAEIRVHDDIASAPVSKQSERRGIAGDIFVLRCTAAAADRGDSFAEVLRVGEKANHHTRSLGVALGAASSIDTGKPMFELPFGQLEIGMGLHGEMGVQRSDFEPAEKLVPRMIALLNADFRSSGLTPQRVAVLINGLGSTTILELLAVAGHTRSALDRAGIEAVQFYTGLFATSLDMAGFSITWTALDQELEPLFAANASSYCFSTGAKPAKNQ
jgi:phosphoenolpyruvate---glycerone phosphotransferase subunit DhaK